MIHFGKSKRGNAVIEAITVVVVITVLAICSIVGYMMFSELNTDLQADSEISSEAKAISSNMYSKYVPLLDNIFLFVFVMLVLFAVVAAYIIDTHPILFFASIILLAAVFVVTPLIANSYDDIMIEEDIAPYANQFTYTGWVMTHLLELIIAISFMIIIVLFVKFRSQ